MRKGFTLLIFFLAIFGILSNVAEAARFGGGRSFGAQRSFSSFSRSQPINRAYSQAAPRNSWAAPLAGLALGSLLGYFMMGHGLGTGLLSWLLLLGAGLMIWNLVRTKMQPYAQAQTAQRGRQGRVFEAESHFTRTNDYASGAETAAYPAGFEPDVFLRDAKLQFIRLQAAFDAKDLKDLREFTAPEVFAEIKMQLDERGEVPNHTEVVSLNADLLDASVENHETVATVKFSGVLREGQNAPANFFEEAWHFRKAGYNKWLVTGVQQNSH
jgi:predicted lipid-binding transport protein (Tim44 family)